MRKTGLGDSPFEIRVTGSSPVSSTRLDAITIAIRSFAARCSELDAEAHRLEHHIDIITATAAPHLCALYSVGPDTASTLLNAIATTRTAYPPRPPSPSSAASRY